MKKTFLVLFAAIAVLAACNKPETPKDDPKPSTESKDPSTSADPSTGPSDSEDPTPAVVTGKVILDGKKGFNSFAEAMLAAKTAGQAATFTLSAGTLAEDILLDEPGFPVTIDGKEGAVLDGTVEIHKAEVTLRNFAIIPTNPGVSKPAVTVPDSRNNWPFAIFVHDTRYGFKMQNVTVDVGNLFEGDAHENTTALVLRGETKGPKEESDEVRGCTFIGDGQRLIQIYDAHVDLLGNTFENFYSGYAIRLGEDNSEYFENEIGPRVTIAGNTFSSPDSRACINFYSVFTAQITFGNGENDTNIKGDGIALMYTANAAPGSECEWKPEMLYDSETGELYPAEDQAMPQAELVWAKRAGDSWWTTSPMPGFINPDDNTKMLDWNRSVAMDDKYVYMPVARRGVACVYYFPIDNPSEVKELNVNGITVDNCIFPTCGCQVVQDVDGSSVLLVGNMVDSAPFKVYKWKSVDSAPELAFEYSAPKSGLRIGDKLSFAGTLADGEFIGVNYYVGGRFWILPVKNGQSAVSADYFGENGWNNVHRTNNVVGATRYQDTNAYIFWGAWVPFTPPETGVEIPSTRTAMFSKGEDGMEHNGTFEDFSGMFDPVFFRYHRASYMAFTMLSDASDGKYFSTVRVVRLLQNGEGNDSPYVTMSTGSPASGLVLGISQPTSDSVVLDENVNGNMVAALAMRNIGGTIYLLGSDTNNALALYKLK